MNAPRHEFSRKTKRLAWERCNGMCEGWISVETKFDPNERGEVVRCNAPLDLGRFEYDHHDPDFFSKNNELENCIVLCLPCHDLKTSIDKTNIAKTKRIRDKRIGALKSKRGFRSWRKFDGSIVHADRRR